LVEVQSGAERGRSRVLRELSREAVLEYLTDYESVAVDGKLRLMAVKKKQKKTPAEMQQD
jgi:hypothetical protein